MRINVVIYELLVKFQQIHTLGAVVTWLDFEVFSGQGHDETVHPPAHLYVRHFCQCFDSVCVTVGRLAEKGVISDTELESDESSSESSSELEDMDFDDSDCYACTHLFFASAKESNV